MKKDYWQWIHRDNDHRANTGLFVALQLAWQPNIFNLLRNYTNSEI